MRKTTFLFILIAVSLSFSLNAQMESYFEKCYRFNNSGGYIELPNESNFDFTTNMTLELWVVIGGFDMPWQTLIAKGDSSWRLHRYDETNQIRFTYGSASVTSDPSKCDFTNGGLFSGFFHHIEIIKSGAVLSMYVDGVLHDATIVSGTATNNYSVRIGDNAQMPGRYFNGWMDEIRIWNTARTPEQITANKYNHLSGNESGLVAYYKLDDESTTIHDETGNNNGTLHEGGWWADSNISYVWTISDRMLQYGDDKQRVIFNPLWESAPSAITAEAWFYPEDMESSNRTILYHGDHGEFEIYTNNTTVYGQATLDRSGSTETMTLSWDGLNPERWYHVALVVDTGGTSSLYINGVIMNSSTQAQGASIKDSDGSPLGSIGSKAGSSRIFEGYIDEVRIWETARTASEIWDNRHVSLTAPESNLLANYTFDEVIHRPVYNLAGPFNAVCVQVSSETPDLESTCPIGGFYLGGTYDEDQEITSTNITVWDDLTIPAGETMNLLPGTTVTFHDHYGILVQGALQALGTEADSIRFTIADTTGFHNISGSYPIAPDGSWAGITLNIATGQDSTIFDHCILDHGKAVAQLGDDDNERFCGGAMFINSSGGWRISNSRFSYNYAYYRGGALWINDLSECMVTGSVFSYNKVLHDQGFNQVITQGGAICFGESHCHVENCRIVNNFSNGLGGGIASFTYNSEQPDIQYSPVIRNNYIGFNYATESGGGIGLHGVDYQDIVIHRNEICHNEAQYGGGIGFQNMSDTWFYPIVQDNVIYENEAEYGGGIYMCYQRSENLWNNTIVDNEATISGGGLHVNIVCDCSIVNTIIRGNEAPSGEQVYLDASAWHPDFRHCDIEGGFEGFGGDGIADFNGSYTDCFDLDPDFTSGSKPYQISDTSPCINRGEVYDGLLDTDFLGNPRSLASQSNINSTIDTILNAADIGAYEEQTGRGLIPQDITLSGQVTINVPIAIAQGYTLTVNPSTTLRFTSDALLGIYGSLQANGTLYQKITFNESSEDAGWGGIYFGNSADSSYAEFINIWNGNDDNPFKPHGGNLCIDGYDNLTIKNCMLLNGNAENGGTAYIHESYANILGGLVLYSEATVSGGAFYIVDGDPGLYNLDILFSEAPLGSAIRTSGTAEPDIGSCIIWDNGESPVSGNMDIRYCCVEGGAEGSGNISDDPQFLGSGVNPYQLTGTSPCLNAGFIDGGFLDLPDIDYIGNPRIYEHAQSVSNRVDMGAYEFQGMMTPWNMTASDGNNNYNGYVYLEWEFDSDYQPLTGFRVYRNNVQLQSITSDARSYADYTANPGEFYEYTVVAYAGAESSSSDSDYGYMKPNGIITGNICTPNDNPVSEVIVSASPAQGKCLDLGSELVIDDPGLDTSQDFTWEIWVKLSTANFSILYQDIGLAVNAEMWDDYLRFVQVDTTTMNITALLEQPDTTASIVDGQWHHLAVVYDASQPLLTLYIDAEEVIDEAVGITSFFENDLYVGVDGSIDELRFFDVARTQSIIDLQRNLILPWTEPGLIGYWPMNEGAGDHVFDGTNYSHVGTFSSGTWSDDEPGIVPGAITDVWGDYAISQLSYGSATTFTVTPTKAGHNFQPEQRLVTLSNSNISQNDVDFTDNSMISVSGIVRYIDTQVPVEGASVLLNGSPTVPPTLVDEDGEFTMDLEHGTEATLSVSFEEHEFDRVWELGTVTYPRTGINFWDIEKVSFALRIVGGDEGYPIGSFDVLLREMGDRYTQEETNLPWGGGIVAITNVPPLNYSLTATADPTDDPFGLGVLPSFEDIGTVNVDLRYTETAPDTVSIVWHNDLSIEVIWPTSLDIKYMDDDVEEDYGFYVLPQNEWCSVRVRAFEDYRAAGSPAFVTYITDCDIQITDEVGTQGETDDNFDGENYYAYTFAPYLPNIIVDGNRRHQNMLEFTVHDTELDRYATQTDWVLTEGTRPMESTFATTSPELPFLVLHDPPGDCSYSSFSQTSSASVSMSVSAEMTMANNQHQTMHMGPDFSFDTGLFYSIETEIDATFDIGQSVTVELGMGCDTETQYTFSTTEEYNTSPDNQLIGLESDLFVGGAVNLVWGITKEVAWNDSSSSVDLTQGVMVSPNGFDTIYMYTESQIRLSVIPNLIAIGDTTSAALWQSYLDMNEDNIENAVANPNHPANVSFNAGAGYTYEETCASTEAQTFFFTTTVSEEFGMEFGFTVNGMGDTGGFSFETGVTIGQSIATENEMSTTTTFVLADDDETSSLNYLSDYFTVDIKMDPVYGTPVFETIAGASSNRWEPNTLPRDGVNLTANTYAQSGLEDGDQAVFLLSLQNTSQSEEYRRYYLTMHHDSNPGGATVKINGVPLEEQMAFDIPPSSAVQAVMTVDRGPYEYDYEDLALEFYAPGDRGNDGPDGHYFYVYKYFDVHWEPPYSRVDIQFPNDDWIINQSNNDTLNVILAGYDIEKPYLESLLLQYKKTSNRDWITAAVIPDSVLADYPYYIQVPWDASELSDGAYEIRAGATDAVQTENYYCTPVSGYIDRISPALFTSPQPQDGILSQGDQILLSLTEAIDPVGIDPDDIRLTILDNFMPLACDFSVFNNEIVLTPASDMLWWMENHLVQASVEGITDLYGNPLEEAITWEFFVNANPVGWSQSKIEAIKPLGDEMEIDMQLINSGGQTSSFTIEDLPEWLTVDVESGQLYPLDSQSLTFTVNEQLGYGTFRDTIYADIPGLGREPLVFEIGVLANPPAWASTPLSNFEYSMTITGQLNIDEEISTDTNDIIGVFVLDQGGAYQCRGFASIHHVPFVDDAYQFFLTVHSDEEYGDTIYFRTWDSSENKEHFGIEQQYLFLSGAVYGTSLTPVVLDVCPELYKSIDCHRGWTWFSINLDNETSMQLNDILSSLSPAQNDLIKSQTEYAQYVEGTGWVGSLSSIETTQMFKIKLAQQSDLQIDGLLDDPQATAIAYCSGWNWIGYLPHLSISVNEALAGLPNPVSGDLIKNQTGYSQYIEGYGWYGSLLFMNPGEGYMLKTVGSGSFYYPDYSITRGQDALEQSVQNHVHSPREIAGWEVDPLDYEYSSNITAVVAIDDEVQNSQNLVLGAFCGDECRGVASLVEVMGQWTFFLTQYSNAIGETIRYRIYDPDLEEVYTAEESIVFISNQALGNPLAPYVFHAESASLRPPQNVRIQVVSDNVMISWDAVEGAETYHVYQSVFPDGSWNDVSGDGVFTQERSGGVRWTIALPEDGMRFFRVTSDTEGSVRARSIKFSDSKDGARKE